MKFLALIYHDPAVLEAMPKPTFDEMMSACIGYDEELKQQGKFHGANRLQPHTTAKTLRHRGGKLHVSDGPFAETKEVLGSYQVLEAADLDEAIAIASKIPWTHSGSIEIRPIVEA
jgi:hypothetical protein